MRTSSIATGRLAATTGAKAPVWLALICAFSFWGPARLCPAQAAVSVPGPEASLLLSSGSSAGASLSLQPAGSNQPPFRLQLSTNLQDWVDLSFVTNTQAPVLLSAASLGKVNAGFFRVKPMGIDLTNWKLQLPVNTTHSGAPDEIKQPELAGFQMAPYFSTNTPGRGIVFSAPCGGITTTGSAFPRCELREMTNNVLGQAVWSTTSGTHTLELVEAFTHLPVVKPDVAGAQVHDTVTGVLMLKLHKQELAFFQNGVKGRTLTTNYHLGDVFSVKIVAHDGGIDYYYNGNYMNRYVVANTNCYFKTGCYTLSNTNSGDAPTAYGEVILYNVSVSHK